MHSTGNLVKSLQALRRIVETAHRELRTKKVEAHKAKGDDAALLHQENFRQFTAAADLAGFFQNVITLVERESRRYITVQPTAETETPITPAPATTPTLGGTLFTQTLLQNISTILADALPQGSPYLIFGHLFDTELNDLTGESPLLSSVGANAIPKLKNAQQAYQAERYGDALTILKVTLRNDPHNQTLAFLVSQFLYMLAGQGQQNAHPEARDLAQKAMIMSEKFPEKKILWYRYHSIASELAHSPERALEWLRDTDLANPAHLADKQGWFTDGGCHLKALVLLSRISPEIWGEREFKLLEALTLKSLGGAAFYLHVFRPALQAQENRKDITEKRHQLEAALAAAYQTYQDIAQGLAQLGAAAGRPFWTVRTRFLTTLAQASSLPAFDHVLSNISLNAESWQEATYPDLEIRAALDDSTAAYWRWWALALTPGRDILHSHPLATEEALAETAFAEEADALLQQLTNEENSRKRPDLWEKIQPWIVRWELDHLLAAGTGSNQPRQKFTPSLQPLGLYYHRWSEPVPTSPLASEMISRNAQKGAFGNWYEVLSAFEGAIRLIDDPNHGIIPMQKRALSFAKVQDPNRFAGMKVGGGGVNLSKSGVFIIPLGFIAGVMLSMQMARNAGQAIGIILVMMGLAGMVYMSLLKKKD